MGKVNRDTRITESLAEALGIVDASIIGAKLSNEMPGGLAIYEIRGYLTREQYDLFCKAMGERIGNGMANIHGDVADAVSDDR